MKKKLSLILALILCFTLFAALAHAEGEQYMNDSAGVLSNSQAASVNDQLKSVSEKLGFDVIAITVNGIDEDIDVYADEFYEEGGYAGDGLAYIVDFGEGEWWISTFGSIDDVLTEEKIDYIGGQIVEKLSNGENYEAFSLLPGIVSGMFTTTSSAPEATGRLVDAADLLSDDEEQKLKNKLDEISERQQFDVVVVTVDSTDGKSPMAYADDYYDYNGYGFTDAHDGTLLLLAMDERDWWVSTTGYGITALNDSAIEYVEDKVVPYLSDAEYYDGFVTFANFVDTRVTEQREGKSFKEPFGFGFAAIVSIVIGFIISLIITMPAKAKLKSVRMQPFANDYAKPGSLQLTDSRDIFLYTHVTRTERPKESSSGGGSSTHSGSSGTSHGGGGGKF